MPSYDIGYFVGSLSSTSINRELSRALIRLAPEDLEFTEIPIGNLPLYSPDHDANYPPEAIELKEAIRRSDAVLFCHPGIQPVDSGCVEERDRLGLAAVGAERFRPHSRGRDRHVARPYRHGGGAAEPAAHRLLAQRSTCCKSSPFNLRR